MSPLAVVTLCVYAALAVLTGVGCVRRHDSVGLVIVSAFLWPITWAAWYVVDRRQDQSDYFGPSPREPYRL